MGERQLTQTITRATTMHDLNSIMEQYLGAFNVFHLVASMQKAGNSFPHLPPKSLFSGHFMHPPSHPPRAFGRKSGTAWTKNCSQRSFLLWGEGAAPLHAAFDPRDSCTRKPKDTVKQVCCSRMPHRMRCSCCCRLWLCSSKNFSPTHHNSNRAPCRTSCGTTRTSRCRRSQETHSVCMNLSSRPRCHRSNFRALLPLHQFIYP